MTFLISLTIAIMFGSGCYLLLKHDFIKVVGGIILISHAANFFIMASRLSGGSEPVLPLPDGVSVADPLVQAMTLTAIVIGFGVSALMIALVYRVYMTHQSIDIGTISDVEERLVLEEEELEPREAILSAMEDVESQDATPSPRQESR